MESTTLLLTVDPGVAQKLRDDLDRLEGLTTLSAKKSSIDGGVPEIIITIFAAKEAIRLARDILIKYVDNRKISFIRLGDLELRDVSIETVRELFSLYSKAKTTRKDSNQDATEPQTQTRQRKKKTNS